MLELSRLAETGAYTLLIDNIDSFDDMRKAHIRADSGRKRGAVVVRVANGRGQSERDL